MLLSPSGFPPGKPPPQRSFALNLSFLRKGSNTCLYGARSHESDQPRCAHVVSTTGLPRGRFGSYPCSPPPPPRNPSSVPVRRSHLRICGLRSLPAPGALPDHTTSCHSDGPCAAT